MGKIGEAWYWFNASWCHENEAETGIKNDCRWYNLPLRICVFIWQEWIAEKVCKRFGHKWMDVEDHSFSYCTRCGVDTEIRC